MAPQFISPRLRPWSRAGLSYLLFEPEQLQVIKELLAAPPKVTGSYSESFGSKAITNPKEILRTSAIPRQPDCTYPKAISSTPSLTQSNPTPNATQPNQTSATTQPNPTQNNQSIPLITNSKHWPQYWQDLLTRTPKNPQLVWTYPELARDLGGQADERHRDFLRRLVKDMNLPSGTHAFWPLSDWPQDQANPTLFLSGIAKLKPEAVIFMVGQTPPEFYTSMNLPVLNNLSPEIRQGCRFLRTPAVLDLINNPDDYAQLTAFLRTLVQR